MPLAVVAMGVLLLQTSTSGENSNRVYRIFREEAGWDREEEGWLGIPLQEMVAEIHCVKLSIRLAIHRSLGLCLVLVRG